MAPTETVVWNSVSSVWSNVSCFPCCAINLRVLFFTYSFTCVRAGICVYVCVWAHIHVHTWCRCLCAEARKGGGCHLSPGPAPVRWRSFPRPAACIWAGPGASKPYTCLHPAWSRGDRHCQDTHLGMWVLGSKLWLPWLCSKWIIGAHSFCFEGEIILFKISMWYFFFFPWFFHIVFSIQWYFDIWFYSMWNDFIAAKLCSVGFCRTQSSFDLHCG